MSDSIKSSGFDLVVSFDTTGSMYPVLSRVRNEVVSFVEEMFKQISDLRIGIIAHGDYCDKDNPYTIRILDLTSDKDTICKFIRETEKTYGGDADECYELVLRNARTTMDWGAGRTKAFVLIGDASPHGVDYRDNKDRISWTEEAGLLNDMNVKIFAVHALSYYRSSSRMFYKRIADITGGKYLTLDQFNEVTDLILATCVSQYDEEKLNEFVSIIKNKGRMTRTLARNIGILSNSKIDTGYTEGKAVQKDGLIPVNPGRFQVMSVERNCDIRSFVENNGITFKKGRGFYELTKHETVQQYKEVIIQDRETGEMFTGAQVRERLGLQPQIDKGGVKESLSSRDTSEFRVFVQSTSYNRKLIGGTMFLYEVDDLDTTGSVISDTPDTSKEIKDTKGAKDAKGSKHEKGHAKEVKKPEKTEVTKTKKASKSKKTKDTTSTPSGDLPDFDKITLPKLGIADINYIMIHTLNTIDSSLDVVVKLTESVDMAEFDSDTYKTIAKVLGGIADKINKIKD